MPHRLGFLPRQNYHLEPVWERERDPVSRLLDAVFIGEIFGPVEDEDYL
tara:strand:- start:663 stop:809 length:147 start_codon:yes stop_codon:yes gene_type:complete